MQGFIAAVTMSLLFCRQCQVCTFLSFQPITWYGFKSYVLPLQLHQSVRLVVLFFCGL